MLKIVLLFVFLSIISCSTSRKRSPASIEDEKCSKVIGSFVIKENMLKRAWKNIDRYLRPEFSESIYYKLTKISNLELQADNRLEAKLAIIQKINRDNNYFIYERSELSKLSFKKLRKLRTLFKKYKLHRDMTEREFDIFFIKLFTITQGATRVVDDYIFKDQSEIFRETLGRVARKQLLKEGLESLIISMPLTPKKTIKEKVRLFKMKFLNVFHKLFKNKFMGFTGLPFILPAIKDINLSDRLIQEIILKGYDQTESLLKQAFEKQSRIEDYRVFKRVYQQVAVIGSGYFVYEITKEQVEKQVENKMREQSKENKEQFMRKIRALKKEVLKLSSGAKRSPKELKEELYNELLESTLIEFREKYDDEPTEAEYLNLYFKIYKRYPKSIN